MNVPNPSPISRRKFLQIAAGAGIAAPLMGALDACGGKGKGGALGNNGGGSAAATASSGGATGGKVTELTVPANSSPWLAAYEKMAAQYESVSGVKVTIREFPYGGLQTAMVNAIHAGTYPFDVYHLDEPWTGQFYANGWCVPFDEVDSSYQIDPQILTYHDLPRWDPSTKQSAPSGKVMGLPINGNVNLFLYRKDLYDKLGLSVPKTFDEAYHNGQVAMQHHASKYGYVARAQATTGGQSITYDFMPLLYTYGGGWYDAKWNPLINNPGAVAAMEEFRKLLSLGPDKPQTVSQNVVIAAMQGGQTIQCHTVAAAAANIENASKSAVAGKVGYAVVPAGSSGKPAPASGVWSLTIPANISKARQQAALKFITWVNSKEAQQTFMQAGGIPTRSDTYESTSLPSPAKLYLPAVAESAKVAQPSIRYPFSASMLPVAEETLANIASSSSPVKEGMDGLANQFRAIASKAGYGS